VFPAVIAVCGWGTESPTVERSPRVDAEFISKHSGSDSATRVVAHDTKPDDMFHVCEGHPMKAWWIDPARSAPMDEIMVSAGS